MPSTQHLTSRRFEPPPLAAHASLRAAFMLEVLFGLAAVLSLTRDPAGTAGHFAWTIQATSTAAALGAFYLAVAPCMVWAACSRSWQHARVMVWPTVVFTASQLGVTLWHWDRFHHSQPAFWIWLASYALPPVLFTVLGVWHEGREAPRPVTQPLPRALRAALAAAGVLLVLEGLLGLLWTPWLVGRHALVFTPLTARVASAWLMAVGAVLLSMAREGDRARVRAAAWLPLLAGPLIALQLWRYPEGVDLAHPRLWVGAAVLGLVTLLALASLLPHRMQRFRAKRRWPAQPLARS